MILSILYLSALGLSVVLVKILIAQFQKDLLDLPNERSSHTQPTPRGGGLGFIVSFLLVTGLASLFDAMPDAIIPIGAWLCLIPLVMISFLDDWKPLPVSIRYLVQLLVVFAIVIAGLGAFPFLPNQVNSIVSETGAILLTVIGMTALINFYNFMDGLDGLVAGTAIVQLGFLAIWSGNSSLWILVAAVMGFLVWNWQPAKIFMGDSGSTFIGAAIAIALLSKNSTRPDVWSALSITLPITLDTIYTLFRRLLRRENIFQAHRSHLYQQLHQSGWSHGQVASLYITASLLLSLSLLVLGHQGGWLNLASGSLSLAVVELYLRSKRVRESQESSVDALALKSNPLD
jgi:UDP-N-acetylmuramyl pentapeptide phosphotransferase/UDP-N-acetylglucosamine-1-phosphate transferase